MPVSIRLLIFLYAGVLVSAALPDASVAAALTKRVVFPRTFAPSGGLVAPPEQPQRQEQCLNGTWQFQPVPLPTDFKPDQGDPPMLTPPVEGRWEATPIKIPSPWNVNAFNQGDGGDFHCYPSYPASWDTAQMGWLRRSFSVPNDWKGRRLLLHFEAVAGDTVVLVNGHQAATNFDLFLPFQADVTDFIQVGTTNEVVVGIRKASLFDDTRTVGRRPYPAGSFWGQAIAGIWQDVYLGTVPDLHVADTYVQPHVTQDTLDAEVTLRNDTTLTQTLQVGGEVQPWVNEAKASVLDAPEPKWHLDAAAMSLPAQSVTLAPGQTQTVMLHQTVGGRLKLWSPDTPNLYGLTVSVRQGGTVIDRKYTRFGWREWTFDGNRHLLNGKPFELRGDSWHFMGIPQMSRRYAWSWFTMLKAAHGNAVRLHAQPYPSFYLDMADEMGVCVLDETANWGSDGQHKYDTPDFWTRADDQVSRLIQRDRNHASVFGWSVSNEVAWFINRSKSPDLFDRLKQGWRDWLATARRLDPTRPWVSTDGDGDAEGIMPTVVVHYSSLEGPAKGGKPYGVGETGGAYSDTPKQVARWVGPRAYASQRGRMEGIATEAYSLIVPQRRLKADYASVFNLVWYGLQPLEVGLPDTRRPPRHSDGVFFGPFQEGKTGVQPERLGPYCTTLNPGYDPHLPLYRPWPLFDAVRAAYTPAGPAPSPWDHRRILDKPDVHPEPTHIPQVVVLAGPGSQLPSQMIALGATVTGTGRLLDAKLIVIDGTAPPTITPALLTTLARRVTGGATCLVWGIAPGGLSSVNALLPKAVRLTDRAASSLVIQDAIPLAAGIDNGDLYFTETQPDPIIRHGLAGPLTEGGRVIVAASPTDWRRWNFRPEPMKTAATVRSEREARPAGPVIVSYDTGLGHYLVSTLDLSSGSPDVRALFRRMLANLGVTLVDRPMAATDAFDAFGTLKRALVCGSFPAPSAAAAYDIDNIGIGPALHPRAGDRSSGLEWRTGEAGGDGVFNFLPMALPGPHENCAVYLSFWVWSPRPLDNLLLAPNMPKLDLLAGSDDGCQIYLNGKLLQEDRGTHPLTPGAVQCKTMPLQRGWNHFIVKTVQGGGEWQFRADLRCSDPQYLSQLQTSVIKPGP